MPNQDGSLTGADEITLVQVLNRIVPFDDHHLAAGTLGMLDEVQQRAAADNQLRHAFMRVTEALSLDLLAEAVGGFAALSAQEQVASLHGVENVLPEEFGVFLGIVRDVYYEDARTPDRPDNFEGDNEEFGKISTPVEEILDPVSERNRPNRTTRRSPSTSARITSASARTKRKNNAR
jgi:hypothetical protein